ncbi:hypothetical protein [Nostoc sp. 'Peltigera membranacea cyanobiont' N6]|uniref:hypothetical protein n=1 Tax=Nostoc sp. 'Peltigera membranacea cyanobiont' N6 TaxID=1261031 RepID=UPI0011B0A545|nr:hypothetical protein [Nostoc sp. 'Peltigera membranacea cyanobiont' N6]
MYRGKPKSDRSLFTPQIPNPAKIPIFNHTNLLPFLAKDLSNAKLQKSINLLNMLRQQHGQVC